MMPLGIVASARVATITAPVFDSFNRANGPLGVSDTGQTWQTDSGSWQIISGRAYGAPDLAITVVETGLVDQLVSATMTPHNVATGPYPAIVARFGLSGFYMLHDGYLWKYAGGGYGVFQTGGWAGDRLGLSCKTEGSSVRLTVFADGIQQWTGLDATPHTGTSAGLCASGAAYFDNFTVEAA